MSVAMARASEVIRGCIFASNTHSDLKFNVSANTVLVILKEPQNANYTVTLNGTDTIVVAAGTRCNYKTNAVKFNVLTANFNIPASSNIERVLIFQKELSTAEIARYQKSEIFHVINRSALYYPMTNKLNGTDTANDSCDKLSHFIASFIACNS